MEIDLRLLLILIGIIVIGVIVWDGYRKKRIALNKSAQFNQQTLDEMMESRDGGGFDISGVGLSRIIGDDELCEIDGPLVATRDDDSDINDEALDGTGQDDAKSVARPVDPELIITVTLMARSEDGFIGEKLLHCMLSRGLRFGEMNIFHRHKNTSGEGRVQFSLANAIKPGTFDLDDMGSFQTKGITMFMILPGPEKPMKSYKLMLDTAQHLAAELDGQLLDGSRSVLTQQTIQHFDEQIQDFERRNIGKKNAY